TLNASALPLSVNGFESHQLILGYFARANYNFDQKYLLSVNARYDGASNLGEFYKWGLFPGVSLGWNIHREKFWGPAPDFLNRLMLRVNYCVNGNFSGLGDYQDQGEYSVGNRDGGNPVILNSILANAELQ